MRISDWSSDVCSSDLPLDLSRIGVGVTLAHIANSFAKHRAIDRILDEARQVALATAACRQQRAQSDVGFARNLETRSEEHTSELQSLMRISYAVFCLKKQTRRDVNDSQYNEYEHSPQPQHTQHP